jgi:hypothetical protein
MTQKKLAKIKKTGKNFLAVSLFFLAFQVSVAMAEDLQPVNAESVGVNTIAGTPVDEILSAIDEGVLSSDQDIAALRLDIEEQMPEVLGVMDANYKEPPSEPAKFNPDSLKYLESQGGLSSSPQIDTESPTAFKLAVKFFERVVFKKDVQFAVRPQFDAGMDISGTPTFDKDTAGFAIIKKGNQSVVVDFDREYDSPPVVTASLSLQNYKNPELKAAAEDLLLVSDVNYIVTSVSKKDFQIMMSEEAFSDIPFSWHALAVDKPKTSKKEGDNLKSGKISEPDFGSTGGEMLPASGQDSSLPSLTSDSPGPGSGATPN